MRRHGAPSQRSVSREPLSEQNTNVIVNLAKPFKPPFPQRVNKIPRRAKNENISYKEIVDIDDPAAADKPIKKKGNPLEALKTQFSIPLVQKQDAFSIRAPIALGMRRLQNFVPRPLHDPCGEFAVVLYDPTVDDKITKEVILASQEVASAESDATLESEANDELNCGDVKRKFKKDKKSLADILGINTKKPSEEDSPKVPVVIDPKLAKILRPHQVEGVKFLYQCVTGMIDDRYSGCIMADEMGLGKTLQCITLMWTLLRQSPSGKRGTIEKCIVVCPSSLVRNWANELTKWLGEGAIHPFAVDGKNAKDLSAGLRQWALATGRQVTRPCLIISYETLRRNVDDLRDAQIGLLLADEGHRLKNGDSLTFTALNALNVQRRVILSGTPIQNDLSEYYSLMSFAIPGLLGDRQEFRKNFENAILKGRDADATDHDVEKGAAKMAELLQIVNRFIIRRTNDILSKYLPVKYEHVVFCKLSPFQQKVYDFFVHSPEIKKMLRGIGARPLKGIDMLKKLCNHPDLLDLPDEIEGVQAVLPADFVPRSERGRERHVRIEYSGKFAVLSRMLSRIRQDTNDKIVLISNYTQTLDMIERLCRYNRFGCLRLDGTMQISKRQKLVDQFNNPEGEEFVFLLSSKAGGCGLNLIGANRLILIDPDWNPAADQQALARVWRDGQKKDCFVYRFISTGTIEEKIFQRQSMKQSLSSCIVDENEDVERLFSVDNLKQLFLYNQDTQCETHETYKCKRCNEEKQLVKAQAMLYGDATTWNHWSGQSMDGIEDLLLRQEAQEGIVSFVFQYISH